MKLLAISDYGPSEDFAGGLVLGKEMRILEQFFSIDWKLYSSHDGKYSFFVPKESTTNVIGKPGEKLPNIRNRFIRNLVSELFERLVTRKWIKKEKARLQEYLDSHRYDYIFLSLQGQMLPRLISEIDFKNTKVIVQYWDPFTWWAREHNLTNLTRKRTLECYRIIDNRADKILVPSEGMADAIDSGMKADVLANRKKTVKD